MSVSGGKQVLTLIGKGQAVVGKTFRLLSIPEECRRCRLYNICMARVKPGRVYRIVSVRYVNLPQTYKCLLTGEDMVPIVAEEQPIVVPIPTRSFIEGVVMTYVKPRVNCNELRAYLNQAINEGTRVRVLRGLGRVVCGNESYTLAEVIPLD
ncbi:UPF0179 family protein [Vulcanisaeta thermophila]|uniref:UPF0179 family protein n=1 Tax=Vulcanisaeta thermophila TaxID=867917 RepID=UPI0008533EFD|nr:UPF0179 family protein [Vulcanisaeta thermophila]